MKGELQSPVCLEAAAGASEQVPSTARHERRLLEHLGKTAAVGLQLATGIFIGSMVGSQASCTDAKLGGQETELCTDINFLDWQGGAELDLGLIDTIELPDTHRGPFHVSASPKAFDFQNPAFHNLMRDPKNLEQSVTALLSSVKADLEPSVQESVARALAAFLGVNAAVWMAGPAYERFKRPQEGLKPIGNGALRGFGVGLLALVPAGGISLASLSENPLESAYSEGLLGQVDGIAQDIRSVVENYEQYGQQIAEKTRYAYSLYQTANSLPVAPERDRVVRILVQTDMHCGVASYEMLHSIAAAGDVDAVVDLGDSTDYGSPLEHACLEPLSDYRDEGGDPLEIYWVKGNHESADTVHYVEGLDHVTVLQGQPVEISGLQVIGDGDPRYSPSPSQEESFNTPVMQDFARNLAITAVKNRAQVVFVHDNHVARNIAERGINSVGSVVGGHTHQRLDELIEGINLHIEGSAGAEGARVLEDEQNGLAEFSVLSFDRITGRIVGGELITVDAYSAEPTVRIHAIPQNTLYIQSQASQNPLDHLMNG